MGDPAKGRCDEILRSEAAAAWKDRLTAAFFDTEARRAVIHEIRASIAVGPAGEETAGLESLRERVVSHLVGLASRDARPPDRDPAPPPSTISGPALEDRIVTNYPHPI